MKSIELSPEQRERLRLLTERLVAQHPVFRLAPGLTSGLPTIVSPTPAWEQALLRYRAEAARRPDAETASIVATIEAALAWRETVDPAERLWDRACLPLVQARLESPLPDRNPDDPDREAVFR